MEINELLAHRNELLEESQDEEGFISDSSFIKTCMSRLYDTKLTDTDDCNDSYCFIESMQIKLNAYIITDSGLRLQLFVVNEESLSPAVEDNRIIVSQKQEYDRLFSKATNFVKKAGKQQLDEELQDSGPEKMLSVRLSSAEGLKTTDVVEVFLLTANVTVETRGEHPSPKRMEFEDETIRVSWTDNEGVRMQKDLTVIRRLIDVNFLYDVHVSQGNRDPLKVDIGSYNIECIQAAMEENYESWLCVLPARLLSELYKRHSSRMLEKNVRSFLQLNNSVNKGIHDTIRNSPEKFIAYNNGLTITAMARELRKEGDKTFITSLTDFQIVNGGQTTATIYFSEKAGLDVSKVRVMAKINIAKNASEEELEDLISRISEYSNAQSRVSVVDLRSRNRQLVKLKSLSESVNTPSGKKWFFERAKGEFNTLVRKNPAQKARLNREFPKERRFTKEELAKYVMAWGEQPWLVKRGGEKVFRQFIEDIAGDDNTQSQQLVDRAYYEQTISKMIMFRTLEKLHGAGKGAIGNLRSAVVPYSLSAIFKYAREDRNNSPFKLALIWKNEGLNEQEEKFCYKLMKLMNNLIEECASSKDFGENAKKQELWQKVSVHPQLRQFFRDEFVQTNKKSHSVPIPATTVARKMTTAKRQSSKKELNFKKLYNTVDFFGIDRKQKQSMKKAVDFIMDHYTEALKKDQNINTAFADIRKLAAAESIKDAVVFSRIGKKLSIGKLPDIEDIQKVTAYTDLIN